MGRAGPQGAADAVRALELTLVTVEREGRGLYTGRFNPLGPLRDTQTDPTEHAVADERAA